MSMISRYTVMSAPARPRSMSNDLAILGSATATIVEFNATRADARAMPRTTADWRRRCRHEERTVTSPVSPFTRTMAPLGMRRDPSAVPTTAGKPSSRSMIAA